MILADFLDLSQDVSAEDFVELLLCMTISVDDIVPLLFILIHLQLVFDTLTVVLEIFSGLIDTLEEVHHVPQSNIDLHFVHVLEDLRSLDLALDLQCDFRSVHS